MSLDYKKQNYFMYDITCDSVVSFIVISDYYIFEGFLPCLLTRIYCFVLKEDLYYPHPLVQDVLWASLHNIVEPILMHWPGKKLREKAIQTAIEHIHYEDENTRYICIGPVNKVGMQRFITLLFFYLTFVV